MCVPFILFNRERRAKWDTSFGIFFQISSSGTRDKPLTSPLPSLLGPRTGGPSIGGSSGKGDKSEVAKTVDLKIHCTYEGKRTRHGRDEAVMTFVGQVKGRSKGTEKARGDVAGKYAVDIEGGFVSLVQIHVVTEIELPGGDGRLTFTLDVDADRGPGNPLNIPPPRK